MIAALCVASRSVYKRIEGVDCFDRRRDVRTFGGGMRVIAHPPCRGWSLRCRHQAHADQAEKDLGILCADWVMKCGGVLEHPAHSLLFDAAGLPRPGQSKGDAWSVSVAQSWWGYGMPKNTWLCFVGIDRWQVSWPLQLDGGGSYERRWQVMSHAQRSATCEPFAKWLVATVRRGSL